MARDLGLQPRKREMREVSEIPQTGYCIRLRRGCESRTLTGSEVSYTNLNRSKASQAGPRPASKVADER